MCHFQIFIGDALTDGINAASEGAASSVGRRFVGSYQDT
jgi:hypothetical protein